LNQLGGHWLLSDALNYFITLNLRMRGKKKQLAFDPFIVDDDGRGTLELSLLAFNIRKNIARIFYSFFTF
jgi:hypothetical protein